MSTAMTFRDAVNLGMRREMENDPTVFVYGVDVADHKRIYGTTRGLLEQFGPRRCFSTPLCEDALTGIALGAALSGLRPVLLHIRADFMLLGMNQIANMLSAMRYMSGGAVRVPVVIRAVIGRGWGQSAQHSKSLHGVFAHLPGLKVVMPSRPQDAYSLIRSAIRDPNPVIFLEHRWMHDVSGPVNEKTRVPLGRASVIRRGRSLTVLAVSWMNVEALHAAKILARRGIELEVIDIRSMAPLDRETIVESVCRTGHCLVADYDWVYSGFSAELAAIISRDCFGRLKKPVERIGFAHAPCPATRPLENLFYPSARTIIERVERMLDLEPTDLSGESFFTYENNFKGPF
jgi:pyruvate dehydrogenase E1 component beta subunit